MRFGLQVDSRQVSPEIRSLFDSDMPAGLRCCAVLDGQAAGRIWVDDEGAPTWGVVQEAAYGTIYPAGAIDASRLRQVIAERRKYGDVLLGLWRDDARLNMLPPDPDYVGAVLDFTDRPIGEGLDLYLQPVPQGCEVRRVDHALLAQSVDYDSHVAAFGSVESVLEKGYGLYLMRGDAILCEAVAGPPVRGTVEVGVTTREPHRRRGYATVTCAHLIRACEALGYQTYWNCDARNRASVALARKLGYRREKAYQLFAWFKTG